MERLPPPDPPMMEVEAEDDAVMRVSGGSGNDCKRVWSSLIVMMAVLVVFVAFVCLFF